MPRSFIIFSILTRLVLSSAEYAGEVETVEDLTPDDSNAAADQLLQWAETHPVPPVATSSYGVPVDNLVVSMTAGPRGPMLLQDITFIDVTQSMNRERIPSRVVHAKGAGALGTLKITADLAPYTYASLFRKGYEWNVTTRFSRIGGESGTQDTVRDARGFSVKIYTDQGVLDLLCNNSPIFFIRDPLLFVQMVHAIMRNPSTHLLDANAMWDFFSNTPQSVPQLLNLFGDNGLPLNFRHIDGFSINAFTFVNATGHVSYVKFRWRSNQGVKYLTARRASQLASTNPDYYIEDLYNAIGSKHFPSWNLTAQILTPEQVAEMPFYPFDATKDWNTTIYPEMTVGLLTLNQNPSNYFAEVETIGFDPGRLVPGIEPTVDRLLQGRIFAYTDAQMYRLGTSGVRLFRNNPESPVNNYLRDGPGYYGNNQGGAVNYYPNSFNGPVVIPRYRNAPYRVNGEAARPFPDNSTFDNLRLGTHVTDFRRGFPVQANLSGNPQRVDWPAGEDFLS